MGFKRRLKRICRRLFYCKHEYIAYQQILDGNRMRTVWKCTRCGKEYVGK